MPETPVELYARAMAAADVAGRLPIGNVADWDVFPFERDGLRTRPLLPPVDQEPPRFGESGTPCGACGGSTPKSDGLARVWQDERWHIVMPEPSGSPLILLLQPHRHFDLPELPGDMAAELGMITVRLSAAIESLPQVARAHVVRWGDGGAHAHVWFIARPVGFEQLRGTMMALWDDLLPPVPRTVRDADVATVVHELIRTYGGSAPGRP